MAENQTGVIVRPHQLSKILAKAIPKRLPVLVVGAPGIGKSSVVEQACEAAGYRLIVCFPALSDPTEFKGLPWAEAGATRATFLPYGQLAEAVFATVPTAFFLDDLGQATPAVQAASMSLILNREVNGVKIPDHVSFIGATNRRADRAGVSGLLEPCVSDMVIVTLCDLKAMDI